jgi:SRSO17 transposase
LSGRFARLRVCSAHRHRTLAERAVEWLLIEWPGGEREPTRYWLSTLPEDIPWARLVERTKLRWRIERDYQALHATDRDGTGDTVRIGLPRGRRPRLIA